jgi:hypothetical protein
MRAEDRKPSKRVFPLLQNLDLDNVTFDQVQGVGDPISIEDMNEQEMVDLIIVNLARLCVAGEWDGLLEAGGGEQFAFSPIDASLMPSTYANFSPTDVYRITDSASAPIASTEIDVKVMFQRFVAPKTGTIGDITVRTTATNTSKDDVKIGVYSSSSGLPETRIGDIDIDINGGADLYTSSSWSTAPPLVAGTTYWIGFVAGGSAGPFLATAKYDQFNCLGLTHYSGTPYNTLYNNTGTDYDMPSTVNLAVTIPANSKVLPVWMYKYA